MTKEDYFIALLLVLLFALFCIAPELYQPTTN